MLNSSVQQWVWFNSTHPLFVFLTSLSILGQDHLNKIPFRALVDSGSTHYFVDSKFVDIHHLKTSATPLVALHLFDGSSNSTISEIANLLIIFSTSNCMNLDFYVTLLDSSYSLILGYNWLAPTQSTDWLGKWVNKLLSIFARKSCFFLCRGQHTIGISILFGHPFAIIGLHSFHICIWDLHV